MDSDSDGSTDRTAICSLRKSRPNVFSNKLISILKQKEYLHKGQVSELIVGKCITLDICQFKIVGKNSLGEKAGIEYKLNCSYYIYLKQPVYPCYFGLSSLHSSFLSKLIRIFEVRLC